MILTHYYLLVCIILDGGGDPRIRTPVVGDKIQGYTFSSSHCILDVHAKAVAKAGVRVGGLGLREAVFKLHPRKAHSPRRCEEIYLN